MRIVDANQIEIFGDIVPAHWAAFLRKPGKGGVDQVDRLALQLLARCYYLNRPFVGKQGQLVQKRFVGPYWITTWAGLGATFFASKEMLQTSVAFLERQGLLTKHRAKRHGKDIGIGLELHLPRLKELCEQHRTKIDVGDMEGADEESLVSDCAYGCKPGICDIGNTILQGDCKGGQCQKSDTQHTDLGGEIPLTIYKENIEEKERACDAHASVLLKEENVTEKKEKESIFSRLKKISETVSHFQQTEIQAAINPEGKIFDPDMFIEAASSYFHLFPDAKRVFFETYCFSISDRALQRALSDFAGNNIGHTELQMYKVPSFSALLSKFGAYCKRNKYRLEAEEVEVSPASLQTLVPLLASNGYDQDSAVKVATYWCEGFPARTSQIHLRDFSDNEVLLASKEISDYMTARGISGATAMQRVIQKMNELHSAYGRRYASKFDLFQAALL